MIGWTGTEGVWVVHTWEGAYLSFWWPAWPLGEEDAFTRIVTRNDFQFPVYKVYSQKPVTELSRVNDSFYKVF